MLFLFSTLLPHHPLCMTTPPPSPLVHDNAANKWESTKYRRGTLQNFGSSNCMHQPGHLAWSVQNGMACSKPVTEDVISVADDSCGASRVAVWNFLACTRRFSSHAERGRFASIAWASWGKDAIWYGGAFEVNPIEQCSSCYALLSSLRIAVSLQTKLTNTFYSLRRITSGWKLSSHCLLIRNFWGDTCGLA